MLHHCIFEFSDTFTQTRVVNRFLLTRPPCPVHLLLIGADNQERCITAMFGFSALANGHLNNCQARAPSTAIRGCRGLCWQTSLCPRHVLRMLRTKLVMPDWQYSVANSKMNTSCTAVSDLLVVDMFERFLRHVLHFFPPLSSSVGTPFSYGRWQHWGNKPLKECSQVWDLSCRSSTVSDWSDNSWALKLWGPGTLLEVHLAARFWRFSILHLQRILELSVRI